MFAHKISSVGWVLAAHHIFLFLILSSRDESNLMFIFLLLVSCQNVKQSIGISTNPFSQNVNEKTKFNYKITFGKIRPKEDDD